MKSYKFLLMLFLMILVGNKLAQAADLILDTNLAFKHDGNISLVESKNDIFSDEIVT